MSAFQPENCLSWRSPFMISEKFRVVLKEQIKKRTICPLYFKPCGSMLLLEKRETSAIINSLLRQKCVLLL